MNNQNNSVFQELNGTIKLGELFCGPGGIGLGASLAHVNGLKIDHIWATDYDKDTCKTYKNNIHPKEVICEDIRTLNFENILKKHGRIDCLTFGFPCNDFSAVGEKKGLEGTFGALYQYCVNALNIFKPKFFIAENVSGLKNANDGSAFIHILKSFQDVGYKIYPNLYCFETYGIPQRRHRIIIVGIRNDIDLIFKIPSNKPFEKIDNSVRTALKNIPEKATNNEKTIQSTKVIERLKYIKEGENAFTATLPPELQLNIKGAKMALEVLKSFEHKKRILITPGIVELGDKMNEINQELGRCAADSSDFIILVGAQQAIPIYNGIKEKKYPESNVYIAKNLQDALSKMNQIITKDSVVLLENDLPDNYL